MTPSRGRGGLLMAAFQQAEIAYISGGARSAAMGRSNGKHRKHKSGSSMPIQELEGHHRVPLPGIRDS